MPISLAPKESQDVIKEFGRPDYEEMMAKESVEAPLFGIDLNAAFRKWDEDIGAAKIKQ